MEIKKDDWEDDGGNDFGYDEIAQNPKDIFDAHGTTMEEIWDLLLPSEQDEIKSICQTND